MISYLEGSIIAADEKSIVIKADKMGWRVFFAPNSLAKIQRNKDLVKVFTYLYSRESAQELYGFSSFEELKLFELLLGVSGVGPRHAQLIIDSISIEEIGAAIRGGASEAFMQISGIGTKLAKKIVIELQSKIERLGLGSDVDLASIAERDDALGALRSLGYTRREAEEALKEISPGIKGISRRIEEALKLLGKPRG